jgi:cyclopropane fatty-acyl-phospholipid synthase-like methyltransferase
MIEGNECMADWKARLYERYVTTGQAAVAAGAAEQMRLALFPQYRRIIRRHLPTDPSLRIADLGCGHGALLFCLKTLGYADVEGVDVSSEQVDLAHRLGVPEVRQGDLADFLRAGAGSYDALFLMDVLEHMDRQEVMDLLDLAHAALKGGGRLIIHVPNGEGLSGMRIRYGDFTHQLCFTPQSIRQVLTAAGFPRTEVHEERPIVHGIPSLVRRVLWTCLTLRERLLLLAETGVWGHVLSQNMLVVTVKRTA